MDSTCGYDTKREWLFRLKSNTWQTFDYLEYESDGYYYEVPWNME